MAFEYYTIKEEGEVMNIHVVMGTDGDYCDRREWPVKAFYDEELARQRVFDAGKAAREMAALPWDKREASGLDKYDKKLNQYNCCDTRYFYHTVEIADRQ